MALAMRSLISSLSPTMFSAEASSAVTLEELEEAEPVVTEISAALAALSYIYVTGAILEVAAVPSSVDSQEVRVRH